MNRGESSHRKGKPLSCETRFAFCRRLEKTNNRNGLTACLFLSRANAWCSLYHKLYGAPRVDHSYSHIALAIFCPTERSNRRHVYASGARQFLVGVLRSTDVCFLPKFMPIKRRNVKKLSDHEKESSVYLSPLLRSPWIPRGFLRRRRCYYYPLISLIRGDSEDSTRHRRPCYKRTRGRKVPLRTRVVTRKMRWFTPPPRFETPKDALGESA